MKIITMIPTTIMMMIYDDIRMPPAPLTYFICKVTFLKYHLYPFPVLRSQKDNPGAGAISAKFLCEKLGTNKRVHRVDMGDEDDEFLELFDNGITYIQGGRTESAFYSVENVVR